MRAFREPYLSILLYLAILLLVVALRAKGVL